MERLTAEAARRREAQRVAHLVLGQPRPRIEQGPPASSERKRRRRKAAFKPSLPILLEAGIEEAVSLRERWSHKNEGTAETHEHVARVNQGALARLWKAGDIDNEQLLAATDIAEAHARIGADVAVKTASLETRVDQTRMGDGSFYERLGQVRREMAYTRWRAAVGGAIGPVLAMIAGEGGVPVPYTRVAKSYRMHNRRAKQLLIAALDLWPRTLGEVCREVDDATLAAAWAGIL